MKLQPVANPLDAAVFAGRAASGLSVLVHPIPGRRSVFAAFGTNFGSIDRVSGANGEPVPEGLAHFLEHKLFEDAAGDVTDRFAALGASTNAMTGFCGTTYIASTVEQPEASVDLLLDFVQDPYFTDELVAKEQGIIAQEIGMYDDDPDWRVFFELLTSLYAKHPVRDNIAGSVASIAEIDAATLRRCYDLFYHPSNMALVVSGDVQPERIAALVDADQSARGTDALPAHERLLEDEPRARVRERSELRLPVARPRLLLGVKETVLGGSPQELGRRRLATQVAIDLLFGRSTDTYRALYEDGLIDESFSASYSSEHSFGFSMIGGETDEPERLEARVREVLERARTGDFDTDGLKRTRARLTGGLLRASDSAESVSYGLLSAHFRGVAPFSALDWIQQLSADELRARLAEHLDPEALSVCVLRPEEP
ncbi:MAG: peptidase M16 [Planctomycetota bacterium]|nr:MAG: peptidase M16 [Planctomycetota bacterium]